MTVHMRFGQYNGLIQPFGGEAQIQLKNGQVSMTTAGNVTPYQHRNQTVNNVQSAMSYPRYPGLCWVYTSGKLRDYRLAVIQTSGMYVELDALHVYTNLKLIASPTFDNIRAAIQIQLQVPFPLLEQRLQKGDFNAFQNYDPENYVHNTSIARALVPIERFTEQRDQTHIWPVRLWRALGSFVQRTWLLRD